jgi:hypothetical protein
VKRDYSTVLLKRAIWELQYPGGQDRDVAILHEVLLSLLRHEGNAAVLGTMLIEVVRDVTHYIIEDTLRRLHGCKTPRRPTLADFWSDCLLHRDELQESLTTFDLLSVTFIGESVGGGFTLIGKMLHSACMHTTSSDQHIRLERALEFSPVQSGVMIPLFTTG